jgi:hypothetical protein
MHALVRHLADFTTPTLADAFPGLPKKSVRSAPSPAVDTAAIADEVLKRGHEEGRTAACAEFAALRAEDAGRFEEQLAEARQRWSQDEGERLAMLVERGMEELKAEFAERIARILLPFVQGGVRERALVELHALIAQMLSGDLLPGLKLTGPADLIAEMRSRLDVRVTVGDTVLETEMRSWGDRLAQAISRNG